MLTFPLIDKKKPIFYIIILIIWNLGNISLILSVFLGGEIKFNKLLIAFIVSNVIWIIGNLVIKKYKIIGNIEISSDIIKINNSGNILNMSVFKTKKLMLKYFGAKGESLGAYAGLFRVKDGSRNIILFEYEGESYKFEFLITKKHFLNSIYWILKTWKENKVDFKILDQNQRDITYKVLNRQYLN